MVQFVCSCVRLFFVFCKVFINMLTFVLLWVVMMNSLQYQISMCANAALFCVHFSSNTLLKVKFIDL
jgi:hypothetical protein